MRLLVDVLLLLLMMRCDSILVRNNNKVNCNYYGWIKRKPKYPHLLAFHDDSKFSKDMVPVIKRVMKETGLHIEVIDIQKSPEIAHKVVQSCKISVAPFYVNLKTGKVVEGSTDFDNLRAWALGKSPQRFSRSSDPSNEWEDEEVEYRITGFRGRIKRLFRDIKLRGQERMFKKYLRKS